jgi:hypothetical protein
MCLQAAFSFVRARNYTAPNNGRVREIENLLTLRTSWVQVMNTQYAPKLIWCVLSPLHVFIIRESAGVAQRRTFNNSEQRLGPSKLEGVTRQMHKNMQRAVLYTCSTRRIWLYFWIKIIPNGLHELIPFCHGHRT